MEMNFRTEPLSLAEAEILNTEMGRLDMAFRICRIVFPIAFVLFALFLQYDNSGMLTFFSGVIAAASAIGLVVTVVQTRSIRKDLKANEKVIGTYTLKKKTITGYTRRHNKSVKVEFSLDDMTIVRTLAYKAEKEKHKDNFLFMAEDIYDNILLYDYKFQVTDLNGKKKQNFLIPIDYYLTANDGDTVQISFAKNAKRVFEVGRVVE
jgi:hypothetical protein